MPPTEAWLACMPAGAIGGNAPPGRRFGGAMPCTQIASHQRRPGVRPSPHIIRLEIASHMYR